MGFLLPAAFALAGLALPILLFYMLKLRRQPARVSSLMLWQRVIEDQRANAPWQRIRRNLLLLLQLLILALLVMALARPYFRVAANVQGNVVLLLDASASMQATDVAPSRFAAAQAEAIDLINRLSADDAVTLIVVAQSPQILASSTTDHSRLRQLINQAKATNGPADWGAGLNLAAANAAALVGSSQAGTGQPGTGLPGTGQVNTTVVVISDGAFTDEQSTFALPTMPVPVEFISVGANANNQGIVALSLRDGPDSPHLFVMVQNADSAPTRRLVEIQVDGALFDARWLDIPTQESASLTINGLPLDAQTVQVHLAGTDLPNASEGQPIDGQSSTGQSSNGQSSDALAADDTGWAVRSNTATKILLVSQSNFFLARVLGLLPGVTVQQADPTQPLPTGDFDLFIFDRVDLTQVDLENTLDDALPQGNLFFIAPPASTPLFAVDGVINQPRITALQSDDPLLGYVTLNDVRIAQAQAINPPAWSRTLIGSAEGPLLMAGENANRRVAILAFDLHQSNLPLQIDFPILVVNLVRWLLPNASQEQAQMLQTNQPYLLPVATSAERLTILTPLGNRLTVAPDQRTFNATHELGIYRLFAAQEDAQEGATTQESGAIQDGEIQSTHLAEFAVNLLNETETNIQPRSHSWGEASPSNADASTVTDTGADPAADSAFSEWEWWWVLALLGLGVLLVEWWIYWQGRMVGELH